MKVFKLLIIFIFTLSVSFNVYAKDRDISIIDIDSNNWNILKIFLDKNIETNTMSVNSDIKVFRDLETMKISIDLENSNLVHLTLKEGLEEDTWYNLLSVYGAEGTIDFNIEKLYNWLEIKWNNIDWIEKLLIIDSKNIEIYFKKIVSSDSIDVKLLREHSINSFKINSDNKKELDVYLKDEIHSNSKYIIMMFTITIKEELTYNVSNSIYDFIVKWLSNKKVEQPIEDDIKEDNKTNNIALNSAETPDTWAETWILLLATFLLSNFIYFRKRFLKN